MYNSLLYIVKQLTRNFYNFPFVADIFSIL